MIEVKVDSIRVSLMSHNRVVVLKEMDEERYLPIWIGPYEADAITLALQGVRVARPLTHDLLKSLVSALGAQVSHVVVHDLRNDTFLAYIILDIDGQRTEIDSRPSDAIALAVRVDAPIFVSEVVMDQAAIVPDADVSGLTAEEEDQLAAFRDFVESLDMDDMSEG